ncbi:aldehyde oxidoreductase isoform B [Chlorella sorokiniana]|uniref:Aldehyde oxidoreductase isoform A n=1 Tax=Chlorella sorokiniana TaxID=3076 RepID=A0A2P6TMW8_CHLSO|nr:aldehyde oxidoreductase isoform A [Chlorella sorokiniana]PRW45680.1 aldehyde oxidoreductase isoform B [Chlorella sorokiniana]|eukprot:PRW45679.1 aldehyde oxidoreductase isoform A [Chlorella sorokiniana]
MAAPAPTGFYVVHDVENIAGLHLALNAISEGMERRLFERNRGPAATQQLGQEIFQLANAVRDCGLLPDMQTPDWVQLEPCSAGVPAPQDAEMDPPGGSGETCVVVITGASCVLSLYPPPARGLEPVEVLLPRRSICVLSEDASSMDWAVLLLQRQLRCVQQERDKLPQGAARSEWERQAKGLKARVERLQRRRDAGRREEFSKAEMLERRRQVAQRADAILGSQLEAGGLGYRHIDAAAEYQNEDELGAALAAAMRDGTVRREGHLGGHGAAGAQGPGQGLLDKCTIRPAVNQERGIQVTAYSPLGSPHTAGFFNREGTPVLSQDPTLRGIAERHGRSPAEVAVAWAVQRGTSCLPKSTKEEHLRMLDGAWFLSPEGPYRTLEELWDTEHEEQTSRKE